jgi:hypothetical protein
MSQDDDSNMENSLVWKLLPSWFIELWIVWILVVFFVVRVLGSRVAHFLLSWYQHLR